jgi:hypothetical protein
MERNNQSGNSHAHRVIASLNREQVDFLDKIGKDAQFSSGLKLSRTQILAAMVNALRRLNLTGEGLSTTEQLEQRIVDAMMHRTRRPRPGANGDSGPRHPNPEGA